MNKEMLGFEQEQTLEVEKAEQVIEKLDSIIKPIEELKRTVMEMQKMQAEAKDKLNGQFSDQNIDWINGAAEKIIKDSEKWLEPLKFVVNGNFESMQEDYESRLDTSK